MRLSSFVGRDSQLAEIDRLVGDARLVTLAGPGGCGKSRLALATADRVAGRYPDGAWWVDLVELSDPALLPATIAAALSINQPPGVDMVAVLTDRLDDRHLLVILDNCEHMVRDCAAVVEALLSGCPSLAVLATSREPLRVEGETVYPVPSLSLPEGRDAERCESVRLFAERARQASADFDLTPVVKPVAELCRRLDGMPLAIELAAARSRALSVPDIVTGLDDRFALLNDERRSALPRYQTLRASVDWSHALLTDVERTLLRRLSVFAGSFSLRAVRAVCSFAPFDDGGGLDELTSLVDKSLVEAEPAAEGSRYRLLETVRQYAAEKLAVSGEQTDVRDRHLDFYLTLAEKSEPELLGRQQKRWLARLDRELPNLRGAGEWAVTSGKVDEDLRLGAALWLFCLTGGHPNDWAARVEARGRLPLDVDARVRVRFLLAAGWYRFYVCELSGHIESVLADALSLARELADPLLIGRALHLLGWRAAFVGGAALSAFEEGRAASQRGGDDSFAAAMLAPHAIARWFVGDVARGRELLDQALQVARSGEPTFLTATILSNRGWLARDAGDFEHARRWIGEALDISRDAGDDWFVTFELATLGGTLTLQGRLDDAEPVLEEAVSMARETNSRYGLAEGLVGQGLLALARAEYDQAAVVLAEAVAESQATGFRLQEGRALAYAGIADLARGDTDGAAGRWADTERLTRETGHVLPRTVSLQGQAAVARVQGDLHAAEAHEHEALRIAWNAELHPAVTDSLESLAGIMVATGRCPEGTRLFAAAEAHRDRMGCMRLPMREEARVADVTAARNALGRLAFDAASAEGAVLDLAAAVAYATRGRGARSRPATGWGSLTPTELRVVELVALGLTNPQIAERLFISPRTVQSHLRRIFARLDVPNRATLTAEATRRAR